MKDVDCLTENDPTYHALCRTSIIDMTEALPKRRS
jgi:hypothetical protein